MNSITVTNLFAWRGKTFVLHIPSLKLAAGKVLCVTGPNGSGKTTLIETLAGLVRPQTGTVLIGGTPVTNDLRATKASIGFIPDDEDWFVKNLSAREYLKLLRSIYRDAGVTSDMEARADSLATVLHFTAQDQPLERLSHGNKKKVQLIAGLMHKPAVIIVDELRNGLDPLAVMAAEDIMKAEARRGACIVAATHDLWWAQRFADRILLLIDGRVLLDQSTRSLLQQYGSLDKMFRNVIEDTYATVI